MPEPYSIHEEIYSHEYLWRSANAISGRVSGKIVNDVYRLLPTALTTYLAFEAFINFCGYAIRPDLWQEEKKHFKGKSNEFKIKIMLPLFQFNKSKRPYQTLDRLSVLRDLITHGKVQRNEYIVEPTKNEFPFKFEHQWDSYITSENIELYFSDTRLFCNSFLTHARKVCDHPHLIHNAFEGPLGSATSNYPIT